MARRPIYIPNIESNEFVRTEFVEFTWHPGMATSQRQKSIAELHKAAKIHGFCEHPLDISSKSPIDLGVQLSAFNLSLGIGSCNKKITVETAFQSSKVFRDGGPYIDLLDGTSRDAKGDPRIRNSGELLAFDFFGSKWPLNPRTAFYDWLYISALRENAWAIDQLENYDAFTDIEFNPERSINCQAYSAALFKSLKKRNLLDTALHNESSFLDLMTGRPVSNAHENTFVQPGLF